MKKKWQRAKQRAKRKKKKIRKRGNSPKTKKGKEVVFVNNKRHRNRRKRRKPKVPKEKAPVMKSRSLKIVVINHRQQVSEEIVCEYTSPLSEEEIHRERARKRGLSLHPEDTELSDHFKRKSCDVDVMSIAARYLTSVSVANLTSRHRKRPSIIAMLTDEDTEPRDMLTRSPSNSLNLRRTGSSSLSLRQSVSGESPSGGTSGQDIFEPIEDADYMVPLDIIIGYTQCYFGYGKYLTQCDRIQDGVDCLLDCCAWYHDCFTDPVTLSL